MPLTITDAGVDVTITRATRAPTQQDFGVLLFLRASGTTDPVAIVKYTSMAGVAEDYDSADEAYKAASAYYSQKPKPIDFWVASLPTTLTDDPAPEDIMDAIYAVDPGFFGIAGEAFIRDEAFTADFGAWAEANDRVFMYVSNDADCKNSANTTNVMYLMKQAGYSNSCGTYSSNTDEFPEVAAFAVLATTSYSGKDTVKTLKYKDLVGITPEALEANDLAGIKSFNGNVFYEVAGIRMYDEGRVASANTFLDTVIGIYAMTDTIRNKVFGYLARLTTKSPYTEPGMECLKGKVVDGLLQFVGNGFLADAIDPDTGDLLPAFEVTSLPVAEASEADRAARIGPDIQFWAREAGAWHSGKITGTLIL